MENQERQSNRAKPLIFLNPACKPPLSVINGRKQAFCQTFCAAVDEF
jgi:hypothetical protein